MARTLAFMDSPDTSIDLRSMTTIADILGTKVMIKTCDTMPDQGFLAMMVPTLISMTTTYSALAKR